MLTMSSLSSGLEEEEEILPDFCSIYTFTKGDIDAVTGTSWHDGFKHLCPKTVFLPVPPQVLKYLKSDGMVMPQNTHTTAHLNSGVGKGGNADEDDDDVSWASISDTEEPPSIPSEFLQRIGRQGASPTGRGRRRRHGGSVEEDEEEEEYDEGGRGDRGGNGWERQSDSSSSSDDEDIDGRGAPRNRKMMEVEKFHEFDSLLDKSIKELGGAVLPKINRKSPKDATWIGFNRSLKCYNPGDIYLLLKTSDIVSQVLEDPYKDCCSQENSADPSASCRTSSARGTSTSPYFLVLKEWNDSWGPEMEFRCFIINNQLTAICQRDLDTCHSSIVKRKDKLLLNIQNFFLKHIQNTFPRDYYVMDIICHPNGEIYVVDFDVFGLTTDPLLFTYRELQTIYKNLGNKNTSCDSSSTSNDDNRLREELSGATEHELSFSRSIQPCLRFLTESGNFRARKTTGQAALANDVMTYIRECVSKK